MEFKSDNEDNKKRQFLLRTSEELFEFIKDWAEDDFRSINCQIEYLLTECVRKEKEKRKETQNVF